MIAADTSSPHPETAASSIEPATPHISIGILAWNEEEAIETTLDSLFQQSLFARLNERGLHCEIICVANACTDNTPGVAARVFERKARFHPFNHTFTCRAVHLPERGKPNAWNQFVHALSAKSAQCLFLMDGDILIFKPDTMWNMYRALVEHPEARVAVDQPVKDIALLPRNSLRERLSLATSRMTQASTAQLSGQLYCLRAETARSIYLPKGLIVEDGFIKALVCTDFLTQPVQPERVVLAREAAHVFQAYTSLRDLYRNQKRQMIGQTITHVLVDGYLRDRHSATDRNLARTLERQEQADPTWLKTVIAEHLRHVDGFWEIFPGAVSFRLTRLARLRGKERFTHAPAAILGFCFSMLCCWVAYRTLKRGQAGYWPDTKSPQLRNVVPLRDEAWRSHRSLQAATPDGHLH